MLATTQAFRGCLKSSNNMKLSSDASALRISHEGITNFASLSGLDKKSIDNLTSVCKSNVPVIEANPTNSFASEASVAGVNVY